MLYNTGQYIRTCNSLNEAQIVESVLVQLGTWDIQEAGFSEFFNNFVVIATPKVAA
jgi:hypothetical protein